MATKKTNKTFPMGKALDAYAILSVRESTMKMLLGKSGYGPDENSPSEQQLVDAARAAVPQAEGREGGSLRPALKQARDGLKVALDLAKRLPDKDWNEQVHTAQAIRETLAMALTESAHLEAVALASLTRPTDAEAVRVAVKEVVDAAHEWRIGGRGVNRRLCQALNHLDALTPPAEEGGRG